MTPAAPEPFTTGTLGTFTIGTFPSRKFTIPAAVPILANTVAVSVTGVPAATLLSEADSAVAVGTWQALELNSGIAGLLSAMNRGIGRVALAAAAASAEN